MANNRDPRVEKVARAMAIKLGADPDLMVPATGYEDAALVPRWWKEVEWAWRFIAAADALDPNYAALEPESSNE